MAWASINVFNDGVIRRTSDEDGVSYVNISDNSLDEILIVTEKVVALQKETYVLVDSYVRGCRIITESKVFHTPDKMNEVLHVLRNADIRGD